MVSAFRSKGEKSAWQTWEMCAEASDEYARLSQYPQVATVNDNEMDILEKCVVTMYAKSSTATRVNNARLDMFARKQGPYQAIPPTRSALLQHVKRAAYQAVCIWSQPTLCQPARNTEPCMLTTYYGHVFDDHVVELSATPCFVLLVCCVTHRTLLFYSYVRNRQYY